MDDFEDLRDRYEEALDEAEERRREYLEAVRRAGADGRDVSNLAAATGMSESRVASLVGISSPWRRWLVRLALLLILPLLAGSLLMANAPRTTMLGGVVEVQDRASALALAERLPAVPAIEEINVSMRSEKGFDGATVFSRHVTVDPTGASVPDPGPDDEIEWSLGFRTDALDLSGLVAAQEAVSSLLPGEGAATLYQFPGAPRGPLFDVGIGLIYLTILGWLIAGVVALVRFVRRTWRIVRVDAVTT